MRYNQKGYDLRWDRVISVAMLACGIGMVLLPLLFKGQTDVVLAVFGAIGLAFAVRDLRLYRNLKKLRSARLRLHIGKMTGAYIASVTAFLVVNELLPYYLNWLLPTILGSIYISYWTRKMKPKKAGSAATVVLVLLFCGISTTEAQVYVEKQTRHRFAQLTLGLDFQSSIGGSTTFLNATGATESLNLRSVGKPRFMIGGTHFWGHADIYIAIPLLEPTFQAEGQEILSTSGVETVFKYYPWRITENRLRPFIGFSIAPFYFEQDHEAADSEGPERLHPGFPLMAGLTFNHRNYLLEVGLNYNYDNEIDYFISRTRQTQVQTPPIRLNFSFRYMLETTLSAEQDWESGKTDRVTQQLAEQGKLNGFFLGAGMSSAWWLGNSSYNQSQRPFIPGYGISLMADFALGFYLHRPDINIALSYRGYGAGITSYGVAQSLHRRSIGLEATKYLLDYHGFAPFIGPVVSYERLRFRERFERGVITEFQDSKPAFGITFGWDIRPNRLQTFLLRTNLRYFPGLKLEVADGQEVSFGNLEFNFYSVYFVSGAVVAPLT